LATKFINKSKHYKMNVAVKLDHLADNVVKRGVYVVDKQDSLYKVKNYFSNIVIIHDVPFKSLAHRIADSLNKTKNPNLAKTNISRVNKNLDQYYKHKNDVMFYEHTLNTTKDTFVACATESRLDVSKALLRHAMKQLNYIWSS